MRGDFITVMDPIKKMLGLSGTAKPSSLTPNDDSLTQACGSFVIPSPIKPTHPVAVILPVYRGIEMTKSCILAAVPGILAVPDARLIAINDASPDVGMQKMLEQLAYQWPNIFVFLKNESNLGFVGTVNRGFAYFPKHDAVLLNSDVIVPQDWLRRLIDEAYSRADIGTVTPFSNNATICSFPYFCQENAQPFDLDVDSIDAVFKHEKLPCIEAPTGVGFCMYIRRACLDKVGYLNEDKFSRGYGEENDLCQRALKSGWLNLISPNIYAFHEGGVSFSSDKQALVESAAHVIDELHPNYHSDVQRFMKSDPIKHARVTRYVQLLAAIAIPKVLHVSHSLGGGVKQHIEELDEYYGSRIVNILLAAYGNKGEVSISLGVTPHADSLIFSISSNYEHMLELLKAIGISAVHFHHMIGLGSKLLQLSTDLSVARLITIHDYYWLFGNPTLTDEEGIYPGFYSSQLRNLPNGMTIKAWQEPLHSFFEGADCVIFPSCSTKTIFDNVYNPDKSVIAPHVEPHANVNTSPINFAQRDVYTIGVLGALGKEKGADILEELAIKAKEAGLKFNFKVIGYAYRPLKLVEKTGPYETKELKGLIKEHQLDILLFTAQCPETYSYTLSYALDSGLPIIAPNIGVFPERLSGRTNVVLFNHLNPVSELLDKLNTFVEQMSKNMVVKAPVFENDISKHDFYKHEYINMVSCDLKSTEISKQRPFHIDPTWIVAQGFMNKNSSWRNAVIHVLWRLRMSPYLRWFTNAIPPSVRRALRHALCDGNSHEIARGAKDK
jgi:GT2 family glycosyltransferase/glycosyltransferase involved in cell wall biosynthesis